jgi:hypothetical protein
MQKFTKMCEPAKIYLVVTVIFIVLSVFNGLSALTLLVKAAFAVIWTLFLNWLCSKGFSGLAWIIILMPFIFLFLAMFTTMDVVGVEGFKFSGGSSNPDDNYDVSPEPKGLKYYIMDCCTASPPVDTTQQALCNLNMVSKYRYSCKPDDAECINTNSMPSNCNDEYKYSLISNKNNNKFKNAKAVLDAPALKAAADAAAKVVTTKKDLVTCITVNGKYDPTITDAATCRSNGGKWSQSK